MKHSLLLRLGLARSLIVLTTIMVTLSVGITLLTLEILGIDDWSIGLVLAIVIPLFLVPLHTRQTYRHILALEKLNQELQALATTDELTETLTRRRFFELAEEEMRQAKRYTFPITLLMIDIDYFKRINDLHGHAAGDWALRAFGRVLLEQRREVDVVGRLGGEEFAILMPHTQLEGGIILARRIQRALEQTAIPIDHGSTHVTVSIGISECAQGECDLNTLLRQADRSLYLAKEEGRDKIAAWNGERPFLV